MADFAVGNAPLFDSQGEVTNPADEAVVADSGAVPYGGLYEARFIVGASAAANVRIERRNAANGATVGDTLVLYVVAGQSAQYALLFQLETGERIRIVMDDVLVGTVSCAVQIEQRQ